MPRLALLALLLTACAHVQPRPISGVSVDGEVTRPAAHISAARVAHLLDGAADLALDKADRWSHQPGVCVAAWSVAIALDNAGERIEATAANVAGLHRIPAFTVDVPPCDDFRPGDMVPSLTDEVADTIDSVLDVAQFGLLAPVLFVDDETCVRLQHARAEVARAQAAFHGVINFLRGNAASVYVPGADVDLGICGVAADNGGDT